MEEKIRQLKELGYTQTVPEEGTYYRAEIRLSRIVYTTRIFKNGTDNRMFNKHGVKTAYRKNILYFKIPTI